MAGFYISYPIGAARLRRTDMRKPRTILLARRSFNVGGSRVRPAPHYFITSVELVPLVGVEPT
jgi:hypothetical protein